jgi:hypothetical protein
LDGLDFHFPAKSDMLRQCPGGLLYQSTTVTGLFALIAWELRLALAAES